MADILKFAKPAKAAVAEELTFAGCTRLLADEVRRMADAIEAGHLGYDECVVIFSSSHDGGITYDSNLDDGYRIAGILLRSANHAANGDE